MLKKSVAVLKKYFIITIGCLLAGFSLSCFLASNDIIAGGVSGIATIINHFFKIPIGFMIILINIPIFIWGVIRFGKSLGISTLYATILLSVFTDLFSYIGVLTKDMLLAAVFGGIIAGIGYGMVFYSNATTGGVDIIANIIKLKYRHLPLGKIILIVDLIIILFAMYVYKNINIGLYSIISLWLTAYVLDMILEGFNFAKLVIIISDKYEDIACLINTKLDRGATFLNGEGTYTGDFKKVIICTIKEKEIPKLKDIIKCADKESFVLITDAKEVLGNGF